MLKSTVGAGDGWWVGCWSTRARKNNWGAWEIVATLMQRSRTCAQRRRRGGEGWGFCVGELVSQVGPSANFCSAPGCDSNFASLEGRGRPGPLKPKLESRFHPVLVPRAPQRKRQMLEAVRDEAGELGCEVCCPRAGREAHGATPPLEATCEQHETAEPCLSEAARISTLCAESFRPALVGRQCNVMKHHQCSKKSTTAHQIGTEL